MGLHNEIVPQKPAASRSGLGTTQVKAEHHHMLHISAYLATTQNHSLSVLSVIFITAGDVF